MKIALSALAMTLSLAAGSAHAWEVRPVLGIGLTVGGERVATVQYTNGDEATVHSGGLVALNGGVEVRFSPLVSAQALIGYHVDRANASNGSVTFERYPFELLGHFRLTDKIRVGGGARYTEARLRSTGVVSSAVSQLEFKPNVGGVVEVEYFPVNSLGIKLRYVSEKLKSKSTAYTGELDSDHGGLYLNYYFF